MNKIKLILGAAILLLCTIANASPIQWEFDNVTFEDNGLINGSFVFDFNSGYLAEWDINVSGGDEVTYPPFIYSYLTGGARSVGPIASRIERFLVFDEFDIVPPPTVPNLPPVVERNLRITPSQLLDGSTLLVPLLYSLGSGDVGSEECWNCKPFRSIVSGSLAFVSYRDDIVVPPPSVVPAPAAIWLFGTALIGLVGFGKRRKAA